MQRRSGRPASPSGAGEVLPGAHAPHRRQQILLRAVEVRQRERTFGGDRLPQCGEVDVEDLTDAVLHVFDRAVHLRGWEVDEPRREVGDERLELETTPGGLHGAEGVVGLAHARNGTPSLSPS